MRYQEKLRPLPGCVILRFNQAETTKPIERVDGTIVELHLSQNIRYEIGELVAAGPAITFEDAVKRFDIVERHRAGERFPVRWLSGTCFGDNLPTDAGEMKWLKNYRVYRYSELTASIPVEKEGQSS